MSGRTRTETVRPRLPGATQGTSGPWGDPAREEQLVAWCLSALLVLCAGLGSINLLLPGVVRPGAGHWAYQIVLVVCLVLAAGLAARKRAGQLLTGALVLFTDVVYVVLAWSTTDALHYAPPLLLLFPCFVAAWFLGGRALAVQMGLVVVACVAAMANTPEHGAAFLVQAVVSALVLDLATTGVFLLRRREQRLLAATQELSSTDPLTGLANRRSLVEQAPRIWRQARREGQRVVALVLDLDHFKRLNDAFGHAAGDAVLTTVARALAATVRPTDVLARTGGEEMVVLGLVADPGEAHRLAERLRAVVPTCCAARQQQVTASIGAALSRPVDGEDATDALWRLIDRADAAMYQAKQAGRDRVVLASGVPLPQPRSAGGRTPTAHHSGPVQPPGDRPD